MPGNPAIDGNALPSPLLAIVVVVVVFVCAASRAASSHSILTGMYVYDARATGYFVQKAKCRGGGDNVQSRIVVNFFHICDNCAHFCRVDFFPSQM